MAHSSEDIRPANLHRVDTTRHNEIRYWARELKCTPDQLRDAVKAAGASVTAVREWLAKR